MADETPVLEERRGAVALLTLNRPERRNAYTVAMGEALTEAFRRLADEDAVRAVVLTGAGKGFCAGVDLDALRAQREGGDAGPGPRLGEEAFLREMPSELARYPKPLLAAVNGAAVGVGVTMILPFDLRLAAEGAKLALPFLKLGILPGLGSTHLLPRIVGRGRALELVLSGRSVTAEEAAGMGLVNRVVPPERLVDETVALAEAMAEADPDVVSAAKEALAFGAEVSLETAIRNEEDASAMLRRTRGG